MELKELHEGSLTDLTGAKPCSRITARLCGCGLVHICLHDEADKIFAVGDFKDPVVVREFSKALASMADGLEELAAVEKSET